MTETDDVDRLECPKCGCLHFEVSHTRTRNGKVRRRRVCRHCRRPLYTREIPESLYRQLVEPHEN